MMRKMWISVVGLSLALFVYGRASADDKKTEAPDEKTAMEAMMKAATPGEMHKKMEPLIGKWDCALKMWMDPSKPPSEMKGTSESQWIMGNRYLRMTFKGDFGGMPFEGRGVMGYDNLRKTYVGAWIDNFSTGIMNSTGEVDSTGKIFTFTSEEIDPLTGKKFKNKQVTKVIDENKHEETFYRIEGDKENKTMEIVYTRTK
jgi:hypothetical protein